MRRVAITGLGIVSSLGNNKDEVTDSLREGRSGITFSEKYKELGFRSHLHGSIKLNIDDVVDKKIRRFMGDGAAYNYIAMEQAVVDSGLSEKRFPTSAPVSSWARAVHRRKISSRPIPLLWKKDPSGSAHSGCHVPCRARTRRHWRFRLRLKA